MSKDFSHLDKSGNSNMVDVSDKSITERIAKAKATVILPKEIIEKFENDDIHTSKGAVFQTARLAGIMAAKKTSELIPLCHPLMINKCGIDIEINNKKEVVIYCSVRVSGKTGVEMEALTGASIAALTIYDMCKGFSHDIEIKSTRLIEKTGGKSDFKKA